MSRKDTNELESFACRRARSCRPLLGLAAACLPTSSTRRVSPVLLLCVAGTMGVSTRGFSLPGAAAWRAGVLALLAAALPLELLDSSPPCCICCSAFLCLVAGCEGGGDCMAE